MNSTTRDILRFLLRALLVIAPPLLLLLAWYVATDPFKVLRHYDEYYPDPAKKSARIGLNKGMVTLSTFEALRARGITPNAYIFGSSISCYYDADTWAAMLRDSVPVIPFHFDSSAESLTSMARKMRYLEEQHVSLRHALLVLDPRILSAEDSDDPAYIDPPQLRKSPLHLFKYHYTFFRAASNIDFLRSYIPTMIAGTEVDISRHRIYEPQPIVFNPRTNQESIPTWDSLIRSNPTAFYTACPLNPAPAAYTWQSPALTPEREQALRDISEVFARQATDYQIIIGPNRAKIALHPADLQSLQSIFDPARVHDYSSTEAHHLEADTLLYDNTHYRFPFALHLLRLTYQ